MSHIVTLKDVKMQDKNVLKAACGRLGLRMQEGQHRVFSRTVEGIGVFLPNWSYPAVVKADGTVDIDNYNGSWGKMEEFDRFAQAYSTEVVKAAFWSQGHCVTETFNETSKEIELCVSVE